jgi:hypothetical protein
MSETQPRTALASDQQRFRNVESSSEGLVNPTSKAVDRPRPLEFDRNGFPVAQRPPDFVTRVARWLGS